VQDERQAERAARNLGQPLQQVEAQPSAGSGPKYSRT